MLEATGAASIADLFNDIPSQFRNPPLKLPAPLAELDLKREMGALAKQNSSVDDYACFLGAGAYNHFIPGIVRTVTSRSEFLTSYTPYQPEISQGTLQAMYEFQTMVCELTGMEVANDGMYDGATALAEAALMACRLTRRSTVAVLETVSPRYREVLETYVAPQNIAVMTTPAGANKVDAQSACLIVQSPNYFGYVEQLSSLAKAAHASGALLVVSIDPISLGLFKPPGEYGADIVVGEGQSLGSSLNCGGPYLGLFACKQEYLRQMPGRIVGKTVDSKGRKGFVLTMQTREQHIRREKATSNICTAETLVALASTVSMAALGKKGLQEVAETCYHKAHYAAAQIAATPGFSLPFKGVFFKEFVIKCPKPPAELNRKLLRRKIIGGLDIDNLVPNGMLVCVTEMNTREQINSLVSGLKEASAR